MWKKYTLQILYTFLYIINQYILLCCSTHGWLTEHQTVLLLEIWTVGYVYKLHHIDTLLKISFVNRIHWRFCWKILKLLLIYQLKDKKPIPKINLKKRLWEQQEQLHFKKKKDTKIYFWDENVHFTQREESVSLL